MRERYAEGFGPESRFRSWSMAKSVTNALVGLLVREGKLDLDAPAPVPRWQREGDPRRALTLRQLLNMTSGLDNADDFVTGDERQDRVGQLAVNDVQVGATDRAGSHPQPHLARTGFGHGQDGRGERCAGPFQHHRPHAPHAFTVERTSR